MRFLFLLSITFAASASVIVGPGTFSNISGSASVSTPTPGNNNHPGANSPNTIIISEVASVLPSAVGVTFNVLATPTSTEYAVIKTIVNNTSETWTTFNMALNWIFLAGPNIPGNSSVVQFDQKAKLGQLLTEPGLLDRPKRTTGRSLHHQLLGGHLHIL